MTDELPHPHALRNLTAAFVAAGLFLAASILAVGTGIDLIGW